MAAPASWNCTAADCLHVRRPLLDARDTPRSTRGPAAPPPNTPNQGVTSTTINMPLVRTPVIAPTQMSAEAMGLQQTTRGIHFQRRRTAAVGRTAEEPARQ